MGSGERPAHDRPEDRSRHDAVLRRLRPDDGWHLARSGGHLQDDRGIPTTRLFTQDGTVTDGPDMAHGRWYPTVTELADGQRFVTMAGRDQANLVVTTPESGRVDIG